MGGDTDMFDAVVIGGGFYGAAIAIYLSQQREMKRVLLVERDRHLLSRASYTNQARVHNGYHYPRSFTTAYRSRINLPKFVQQWSYAVSKDFEKLYAIARRNSKVTARQFERFCREIGARIEVAPKSLHGLFDNKLIEEVFLVEEYAFDTTRLAGWAERELDSSGVRTILGTKALGVSRDVGCGLAVELEHGNGLREVVRSHYVFNCAYAGLNQLAGDFHGTQMGLKHEITEMALMQVPSSLKNIGVTVMDGPFFSIMPFPARDLHTLSHVRYTPHFSWPDEPGVDPYDRLRHYPQETRVDRMVRDVQRYLPAVAQAQYVESLFEVKTVLVKNEGDDGRPILFEKHADIPGCFSILGGKIDNIFDVLEKLEIEEFASAGGNS